MLVPFRKTTFKPPGFLRRLFHAGDKHEAEIALSNLFVDRDPGDVTVSELSTVAATLAVTPESLRAILGNVYRSALSAFAANDELAQDEIEYLKHLRVALTLNPEEISAIQGDVLRTQYKTASSRIVKATHDGKDIRAQLDKLADALRLPDSIRTSENLNTFLEVLQARTNAIARDRRVSPDEEAGLLTLSQGLGVQLTINNPDTFQKFKLLWQIDSGLLPQVQVPINLQKGERCHFAAPCSWHETRTRTVRVDYSGISASIRIVKGVRYRVGSVTPSRVTESTLTELDSGYVYFTSKRVIFDGSRFNKTLTYRSLLGFEQYRDALMLEKSSGKSPYLFIRGDLEMAATILAAALAASNA